MDMRFSPEEIVELGAKLQKFKKELERLRMYAKISGVYLYFEGYSSVNLEAGFTEKTRRFLFDQQRGVLKELLSDMSEAGIDVDELRDQLGVVNASYESKEPT